MLSYLSLLILLYLPSPYFSLSREEFYPYGDAEDEVLNSSDNASALINLNQSIILFSSSYDSLYVSFCYVAM